ncbi:fatty acid desaturase [Rubritalea sp.]|uniref:fatty acid desaturase n=1 Tax=Rubritalea sp. TaxID=2109375 RepID=UPI003EF1B2C8
MSNDTTTDKAEVFKNPKAWRKIVVKYQKPDLAKASWQLVNTLVPFFALWVAMYFVYDISPWLTIPLMLIGGGLGVRIFIIFHDCGHQSFFKSRRANDIWGYITGVLVFTPYRFWHWEHRIHHSTTGDLDGRAEGDVWTMTVKEYEESTWSMRMLYRLVRNPFILFTVSPMFLFMIWYRFSVKKASRKDRLSVLWTNLGIAFMVAVGCFIFGWQKYLILQLGLSFVANSAGIWIFYVQHQFEDVYWARNEEWNFAAAALEGSSFYKLPKILQWFSGNIGFHHIHHLSSRIPNYRLEECHNSEPLFQQVPAMTLRSSLACLKYRLHDEENGRLVGFGYLKQYRKAKAVVAA